MEPPHFFRDETSRDRNCIPHNNVIWVRSKRKIPTPSENSSPPSTKLRSNNRRRVANSSKRRAHAIDVV